MRTAALALLAVVVLGGCVGPFDGTVSPTAGQSPQDGPTTAPPDTTPAPPASANGQNTVNYSELNAHQQAAFEAALDGREVTFVPNTSYVDDSEGFWVDQIGPFENHEYVRYRGEYYRPAFSSGDLYAQYGIDASAGFPESGEAVVPLSDLPPDVREEVRQAIETGHATVPFGKWDSLPQSLGDTDYVRYENQTYSLAYAVGDSWAPVMTIERIE